MFYKRQHAGAGALARAASEGPGSASFRWHKLFGYCMLYGKPPLAEGRSGGGLAGWGEEKAGESAMRASSSLWTTEKYGKKAPDGYL